MNDAPGMMDQVRMAHREPGFVHVVVIGGGAAGTMSAIKLAKTPGVCKVTLLDRQDAFGRGVAYLTNKSWHRINVPSVKMGGVDTDDPDGFTAWLLANGHVLGPDYAQAFVPRRLYGDYLCALLAPLRNCGLVETRVGEALTIDATGSGYRVSTSDHATIDVNAVVMCLGNHAPAAFPSIAPSSRLIPNVWVPGALNAIQATDRVLVIGTGATAVDGVLDLLHENSVSDVTMLSRRGMLPCADAASVDDDDPVDVNGQTTVRGLLRALRDDVRLKARQGIPWQTVIDAFRLKASAFWQILPSPERARFIRHMRTIWMTHRHRLAPDVAQLLMRQQQSGRLRIMAGQLKHAVQINGGYQVAIKPRGAAEVERSYDWIVNCVGPEERYDRLGDPLVTSLLSKHQARPGPMGLGLDVDSHCELLDAKGQPQAGLYLIGPATRGCFWEVTSVPGIRTQVMAVGAHLGAHISAVGAVSELASN